MKKFIVVFCLFLSLFLTAAAFAAPEIQEQLELIADNTGLWKQDVDYGTWGYTVTDLDQNGYLEIISASLQGTGMYTYLNVFTVDPDGNGLRKAEQDRPEQESAPDVMQEIVPAFFDPETEVYYYIFSDFIRNGYAENFENKRAVWLENETWKELSLANKHTVCTDTENCTDTYTDPDGNEISAEQFGAAEDTRFAGLSKGTLTLTWNMTDNESFAGITREELLGNLANIGQPELLPESAQ